MKLFTAQQIREADKYTIEHKPIKSIDLMEEAARMFTANLDIFRSPKNIIIFCGPGNNGGDGLAIARILADEWKERVEVFIINYSSNRSADFEINLKRLKAIKSKTLLIKEINSEKELAAISAWNDTSIIDALLGIGLNKPVAGLLADTIKFINSLPSLVFSVDIPSGLFADGGNKDGDAIIKATRTISFQLPKLAFFFPENNKYIGDYKIEDIGISEKYFIETPTKYYYTTKEDVKDLLRSRNKFAHKGNFGHALIVAGSYGKMGAAVLSAKACMRAGAGLVTVRIPECGYGILQSAVPEAMADVDTESNYITDTINIEKYNAIGVGPGIGDEKQTATVVKLIIQNSARAIVFDADAITILAENKTWISFIPAQSIFTPHLKEFERLVGKVSDTPERLKQQIEFSIKHTAYIVLKGANTSISTPEGEIYFNSTGNPGMATGGSGDVLTGIITSLLAQGYSSREACILGVYLHGCAGDFASHEHTEESIIASDIINHLSDAYKFIRT